MLDGTRAGGCRRRPDRGGQPARCPGEPRGGGLLRRRSGAVRSACRPSSATCAGTPRSRCSTWPGGSSPLSASISSCGRRRSSSGASRRDQLGAFLDAVAAYVDVDGDASLTGLLAYLQAEIEQGAGLDQAVPSDREAVKLLTVHKAKGLEWEVVFLPALMQGIFPSDRVTDNWVTNPAVLPADLRGDAGAIPQLADATNAAMARVQGPADRAAAAGRGPAGLRRGHSGQTAAGRQRVTPGGRIWSGRGRRRHTCARSSTRRSGPDQLVAEAEPAWDGEPTGGRRGAPALAGAVGSRGAAPPPGRGAGACKGADAGSPRRGSYEDPEAPATAARRRGTGWPAGTPTSASCWPRPGRPGLGAAGAAAGAAVGDRSAAAAGRPDRRTPRNWPGRCPGRPLARRASAPASTSGSSAISAAALATGALGQQPLIDPDDLPDRADAGTHGRAGAP